MSSGRKTWFWRVIFGLLLLGIGAGVFFWLSQSSLLAIENIEADGNSAVPTEIILEAAGPILMGESIFNPSLDSAATALKSLPLVEEVEFDRGFPDTMRIHVREYHPALNLLAADGRTLLLSSDGVVLLTLESPNQALPILSMARPCIVEAGSLPECPDVMAGVQFVADVPVNFNHEFSEITVDDGDIRARTRSGVNVHFGSLDQYGLKFEVLRQLLARTAVGGATVTIDVSVPERPVTREGEEVPAANLETGDDAGAAAQAQAGESAAAALEPDTTGGNGADGQ